MPVFDIGVVALVGVGIGVLWNYVFNLIFDHAMMKMVGYVEKSIKIRVAHAILFETGFIAISAPFVAWYLEITLLHALSIDVSISIFFLF